MKVFYLFILPKHKRGQYVFIQREENLKGSVKRRIISKELCRYTCCSRSGTSVISATVVFI